MTAVVRLQVLREALGMSAGQTLDQVLAEVKRLRAFDQRRVICLEICHAYANGLDAFRRHVATLGDEGLSKEDAMRWVACMENDAMEAFERVPRARESSEDLRLSTVVSLDTWRTAEKGDS